MKNRHDVRKSFGSLEVLKGVDFSVSLGEVVCLIGASGSGKSTLLRCINLLEKPDSGTITVFGENVLAVRNVDAYRAKVGMEKRQSSSRGTAGIFTTARNLLFS